MRQGEHAAVIDQWEGQPVESVAPVDQGQVQDRLDPTPARPTGEDVEGDAHDRHLGPDGRRRGLPPEPPLEGHERQDDPVPVGQQFAVEDPVPGQVPGAVDDLGELTGHVVQIAAVQPNLGAGPMELDADPVVLVLDPGDRPQPAHDLGGVLGR